jgi:hypothetical protein
VSDEHGKPLNSRPARMARALCSCCKANIGMHAEAEERELSKAVMLE